jgi:abortive infection alpha-like protein
MEDEEPPIERDLLRASPALARLAAGAWLRTAQWTVEASVRTSTRVLRAATSGESPADLLSSLGGDVRAHARRVLGIDDPDGEEVGDPMDESAYTTAEDSLRERGAELLRRSADVTDDEDAHPAYDRILDQLAPDEGRILRFLALEGPQPSVDVRGARGLPVTTQLVAPGLSMIGAQAGARYEDRVPAYLNNLYRLGLIWFSREPLEDPLRYQVLEAQPDVIDALRSAGRGRKTVRRSIHLTPFGEDFCRVCLPLDTAELDALGGKT